jgi:hypothetical protein
VGILNYPLGSSQRTKHFGTEHQVLFSGSRPRKGATVAERRNAGHFSILGSRLHKGATEQERKRLLLWGWNSWSYTFPVGRFGSCRPVLRVPGIVQEGVMRGPVEVARLERYSGGRSGTYLSASGDVRVFGWGRWGTPACRR